MKIIEGYEKDMILQAVNMWAKLAGIFRENSERVNKLYENLEQLFKKNVVALEDFEFDELIDSFPIGD